VGAAGCTVGTAVGAAAGAGAAAEWPIPPQPMRPVTRKIPNRPKLIQRTRTLDFTVYTTPERGGEADAFPPKENRGWVPV
jgi:hypothetical protein